MFDLFDDALNKITGQKTYGDFKKALIDSNCTRCGLSEARTHIVVDRGNPGAKVVMIGEAPGEHEDIQGKAFVGRAGQLLDGMLKAVGFDTNEDSLIINVVKCRPPENRAPNPKEAATCIPYLKKKLALVKPKIVLLLGATALKHVMPDKSDQSMKEGVGSFFTHPEYPDVQFMVLYHPAYILRDPRKKPLMEEHLTKFKYFWDELKKSELI